MERYLVEIRQYSGHSKNGHDSYSTIYSAYGETLEGAYVNGIGYLKEKCQPRDGTLFTELADRMSRILREMSARGHI